MPRAQLLGIEDPRPSATSSLSNILRRNRNTLPNHHRTAIYATLATHRFSNVVLEEQREALWYR